MASSEVNGRLAQLFTTAARTITLATASAKPPTTQGPAPTDEDATAAVDGSGSAKPFSMPGNKKTAAKAATAISFLINAP